MNTLLPQFRVAAELEQRLGDTQLPQNLFSFKATMERDEGEVYPEQAVNFLNGLNLHHYYVPKALGGRFVNCEEILALHRVIARRDLAVAITYSTVAWSTLIWIAGSNAQKEKMAGRILGGGVAPCLAYSEKEHGADLLGGSVTATRLSNGDYEIDGEKWPINRATRGDFVSLVASTSNDRGPRSLTAFMIDKRDLDPATYYHLPRVKTLGLRGIDLSGIGFKKTIVRKEAVIGQEGEGLEAGLRGLQVTRTFCASFALGAGDTLLRTVANFAIERQLYGKAIVELPHVRELLANAYVNLMAAECIAFAAARGMHLFTDQFSIWSAIAKVQAPAMVERAGEAAAKVLGARFYMRDEYQWGIFQKTFRDNLIISIFDGSSVICLNSIGTQLKQISLTRQRGKSLSVEQVEALYDLRRPLPEFQPSRIQVYSKGQDAVAASLPVLLDKLAAMSADALLSEQRLLDIRNAAATITRKLADFDQAVISYFETSKDSSASVVFAKAEEYCQIHTSIVSLGIWLHNRTHLRDAFANGAGLLVILQRRGSPVLDVGGTDIPARESLMQDLLDRMQTNQMFSIINFQLAASGAVASQTSIHSTVSSNSTEGR